jgi:hypothetical protein
VLAYPEWLWLPGRAEMVAVYTEEAAHQLAHDGWEARQRRYPQGSDSSSVLYDGWMSDTKHEPEPTSLT